MKSFFLFLRSQLQNSISAQIRAFAVRAWSRRKLPIPSRICQFAPSATLRQNHRICAGKRVLQLALSALVPLFSFGAENENPETSPLSTGEKKGDRGYAYADFLWWRADIDGTDLATEQINETDGIHTDKKVIGLEGKWEPGLRVGVGYRRLDEWDVRATWTRFYGKSEEESKTANDPSAHFLRQQWISFLGPIVLSAAGHWDLQLNIADFELARLSPITQKISLRPHIGARGAWIDLDYRAHYQGFWRGISSVGAPVSLTQNTSFQGSSDFQAGGLRVGSGLFWKLSPQWGLFADFSASLVYGQFKIREKFSGADPDQIGPALSPVVETYNDKISRVRANLETFLGLQWRRNFRQNRCALSFFAGYELSEWLQFNQLFEVIRAIDLFLLPDGSSANNANFTNNFMNGDLGLQGLTVRGTLQF